MSGDGSHMPSATHIIGLTSRQRQQLVWLLLAWAVFIVYGSWVPLNFQPREPAEIWVALWQWSAWNSLQEQRIDTVVNVLLTVPLGFGLALLWINPRTRISMLTRVAIVLLVLPLSLLAEYGQGFLPGRNESLGDVLAQTVGTVLGLVLHAGFGIRVQAWLAAADSAMDTQSRTTHLLHGYLVALLLFAAMPLDLTLDIGELYHKWHDGKVILLPFDGMQGTTLEIIYELVTDVLLWVPVGALWQLNASQRIPGTIAMRAAMLALIIECLQLLVLSRTSDATDVLLSAIGALLGALAVPHLQRMSISGRKGRRIWETGLLIWLVVVVMVYGLPFNVQWPQQGWSAFVDVFTNIPFITYFQRHEFGALNEILRKLLIFLPGGLLARLWLTSMTRAPSRMVLVWLALLALLLEMGQVLLPDRVAELADALLAILGAVLGWRLGGWLTDMNHTLPSVATANNASIHAWENHRIPSEINRWWWQGVSIAGLALALWLLGHMPGIPYNVTKLIPPGVAGLVAALGIALVAWWIAVLPVVMVMAPRIIAMMLPLWLLLHGLVTFVVLRLTIALPMLHKVIGSPVLAWPGFTEDITRFLALHFALLLPLCGGAALTQMLRRPEALAGLLYWLLLVAAVAWPLHWVIVEQAATDNLTELMRNGGSFGTSSWLALSIMAVGTTAGAAACLLFKHKRRRELLVLLILSALVTPVVLLAGLEPIVIKYDQVFSALQFILSTSRDSYADGLELVLRYLLAWVVVSGTLAWLQAPWWQHADRG